jgi:hypothetical protein
MLVAIFVMLLTATIGFAEYTATGASNFPYFHLGCLIITSLKCKYRNLYTGEAVGAFALYAILVALFTSPVVDAIKTIVS